MKTYIPKKIKPEDNHLLAACLNVNYLIDVVTEQQKEIEVLKENNNYLLSKQSQTEQTIKNMNKTQPYTAMRSTGSKQTTPVCCHCEKEVNKPHENVREKVYKVVKSWGQCANNNCITCYDYADKIIAIVKGE